MANKWVDKIKSTPIKELHSLLIEMNENAAEIQSEILTDILNDAKDCEIGKKYGFSGITSIDDFRKSVPITEFDEYRDYIERMKDGEENILFPGKAASFAVTSGTTGNDKYIPDSAFGLKTKATVSYIRGMELVKYIPDLMSHAAPFVIGNPGVQGYTKGGIPFGSASGQTENAYEQHLPGIVVALRKVSGLSFEEMDYLTVLFYMTLPDTHFLSCNNMVHFHVLKKVIDDNALKLIGDIKNGTVSIDFKDKEQENIIMEAWKPDTERADELQKIYDAKGSLDIADIWPKLLVARCWLGSSVGRFAREYRSLFPENMIYMDCGYGASEGKFNIPCEKDNSFGYPALFGYFYEFLPLDGGDALLLSETEPGKDYEMIITSYSGFYRYNIHDVVRISTDENGLKTLCFRFKTKDKIVIDAKTLYASELMEYIEEYEAKNNLMLRFFHGEEENGGLKLDVESMTPDFDAQDFEKFLAGKLEKQGIKLTRVSMLPDGYRDGIIRRKTDLGKSVKQTKLPVFLELMK